MRKAITIFFGIIMFFSVGFLFIFIGRTGIVQRVPSLESGEIALSYFLSCIGAAIAIVVWVRRQDIRSWFTRKRFVNVGTPFIIPEEKVTGIVIPLSGHGKQARWILEWLCPKHAALMYTALSKEQAVELAEEFGIKGIQIFPSTGSIRKKEFMLKVPFDPNESKRLTAEFLHHFKELGIPESEVFVDTTGGTVPMSIGAFQAAEERNISSIYVIGKDEGKIKDWKKREDGIPVYISDHASNNV